jgi:hypothetical protein
MRAQRNPQPRFLLSMLRTAADSKMLDSSPQPNTHLLLQSSVALVYGAQLPRTLLHA